MLLGFFSLLFHTISFVANTVLAHSTLTPKKPKGLYILIWSLNWLITLVLYVLFSNSGIKDWLPYYLLSGISLCLYLYIFEENFAQDFFVFFMLWGFSSFLSTLCNWMAAWLNLGNSAIAMAIECLMYAGFYALIVPLYGNYWGSRIHETLVRFPKGKYIYAAFPFLAFVVYATLFGPMTPAISQQWFAIMLLFEALVIFMYYLLFSYFNLAYDHLRAEDKLQKAELQRSLQKKYYEEVDRSVQRQAKLIHDARHNLLAVASLGQAGETVLIEKYVEQVLEKFGSSHARRYCDHTVANAVISSYIDIAEKGGIAVAAEIDLPESIGIDPYDLCTLFGNTIENAIEACQRIPASSGLYPRRYIDIRSKAEERRLIVRIENSYERNPAMDGDRIPSSKGAIGGIGLESVRMVVKEYSGTLTYAGKDSVFALSAILYPGGLR